MPITVSGTQITFNDGTNQTTAFTGGAGTVTSVATGNGLSGGTITTSGTLTIACPSFNSVGSYCTGWYTGTNDGGASSVSQGSNYSVGTSNGTINVSSTFSIEANGGGLTTNPARGSGLSGTWKWMTGSATTGGISGWGCGLICRVS